MLTDSRKAAALAVSVLDDKKAADIRIIRIDEVSTIADYFVIASGSNPNQVEALIEGVEESLEKAGYPVGHIEGIKGTGWTLMDYKDVVIHIFDQESRGFYDLERIWKDGEEITKEQLLSEL